MRKIEMRTIKSKILAMFSGLFIVMLALGSAGWYAASVANSGLETVYKDRVIPLRDLKMVSDYFGINIVDTAHKVRSGKVDWAQGQASLEQAVGGIAKSWKAYNESYMDPKERQLADKAASLIQASDAAVKELRSIFKAKDQKRLDDFVINKLYPEIDPTTGAIGDLVDLQITVSQQQYESSALSFAYARGFMIGAFILAGLALVASLMIVIAQVLKPIAMLTANMGPLAEGDFTVEFPKTVRNDEIGAITTAANQMARKISATIAEIKASGREVTNASAEISTSTTDLSQRTEEQAASLEETSAAMEELSATVRKNAENAQMANQDATNTRDVADRGGKVVAQAVEAMAKIEESSRKISDIIGVIDEIARQTNLLALNAAVEAARAGEAGRGFAVVASEVRSLAQRSSQAAKDIKDLITNSNGQVKDGVELVNKAGASLNEIVESIKKVAVVVSDIANASIEQATGIEQINKALTQMDEVTQQNSALVEENAATAKTLEHQAKALDEQVAYFQIAAGDDSQMPRKPASPIEKPAASAKPVAMPAAKSAPAVKKPAPTAPMQRVRAPGPARQMQTALATAVNADQDWKEF
jgi:methyl-accepting chemotaxis protein